MAHDFGITYKDDVAYFCGYCNGIMYHVFRAEEHDAWVSGDNGKEKVTVREAKQALSKAIAYFDKIGYPDDDLCEIWYG